MSYRFQEDEEQVDNEFDVLDSGEDPEDEDEDEDEEEDEDDEFILDEDREES